MYLPLVTWNDHVLLDLDESWCSDVVHKILAIFKMFSFFTARSGYLAVPVAMGAGLAFQLNRTPPPPRVVVVGGGIMGAATGKLHFSRSFQ